MIETMLKDSKKAQLEAFVRETTEYLEAYEPKLFRIMSEFLYESVYGLHFTAWSYRKSIDKPHFSLEETDKVRPKGVNRYDFAYIINVLYEEQGNDDIRSYVKTALKLIR